MDQKDQSMARRKKSDNDPRDWITRAAEQTALAEQLPEGPARDQAIELSQKLRSAAEMNDFLRPTDAKTPKPS